MRIHRCYGGLPGTFLTFSLLLLVLALGFVVGRVVARGYAKMAPKFERLPAPQRQAVAESAGEGAAMPGRVYVPAPTLPQPSPEGELPERSEESTGEEPQQEVPPERATESPAGGLPPAAAISESRERAEPRAATGSAEEGEAQESREATYSIQVGVFTLREGAKAVADELSRAGHAARIDVETREGQRFYRVLTGRYHTDSEARQAQEALQKEGFPGFLVRY